MSDLYPGDRVLAPHPFGGQMQGTIDQVGIETVVVTLDDGTQLLVSPELVVSLGEQSPIFVEVNEVVEKLMVGVDPAGQWEVLVGLSMVVELMLCGLDDG